MRAVGILGVFMGLSLLGCSESPPKPKRGSIEDGRANDKSDKTNEAKLDDAGGEVRLENLRFTAPKGWGRKEPQSNFIQAEFVLPRAEGDSLDGRLTLSVAGGSVDANIDRWKDQFGGKPEKAHTEKIDVNGLAVHLVDLTGEYDDKKGPFAPGVKRADYHMIGAIIPAGEQLRFVKAVGPKKTMEFHADKIKAFIRSVKK